MRMNDGHIIYSSCKIIFQILHFECTVLLSNRLNILFTSDYELTCLSHKNPRVSNLAVSSIFQILMILSEVVCAAAKVERGGQLCHLTEHSVISLCDTKYVLYSVICKNIIVFVTIKFLSVSNSFVHLKSLPFARKKLSYIQRRTINIRVPLNITNHHKY